MAEHDRNPENEAAPEHEAKEGAAGALGALGCLSFISLPLTITALVVLFLVLLWLGRVYFWG